MLDDDGGDGGWNGRISEVKVIPWEGLSTSISPTFSSGGEDQVFRIKMLRLALVLVVMVKMMMVVVVKMMMVVMVKMMMADWCDGGELADETSSK